MDIASIITAIGTIVLAWFTYNQYTKNKLTDLKVESLKREKNEKHKQTNTDMASIYGELWGLLHTLKASRVIILQPHPLIRQSLISITFEVRRTGVSSVKKIMQDAQISNYAKMCSDLANKDFIFYKNMDEDCIDKRFKAVTQTNGVDSMMVKRMTDEVHDWTGSLFVDWSDKELDSSNIDYAKDLITNTANNIQYILPEIN